MSRALLLPAGGDVIAAAADTLLGAGAAMERSLAVFPGQRPGHFLLRELAGRIGRPFRAPRVLAMDGLVAEWHARLEPQAAPAGPADAMAVLFALQRRPGLPDAPGAGLGLDEFLPWGFELLAAFEELTIEGVLPDRLRSVQALAQQELPVRLQRRLGDLAGLYQAFYEALAAERLSTRSMRYAAVSGDSGMAGVASCEAIVLAGFYGLTACERVIFRRLLADDRATIIIQDGPGIGELIGGLGIEPERTGGPVPAPVVHFVSAADAHGQVMALARNLATGGGQGDPAVVLPLAETLFPVVESVLPSFGGDWNISLGYPLDRTPSFSLLKIMAAAQAGQEDGSYYAPDYLRLLLHPYVKNIPLAGSSQRARILMHSVEQRVKAAGLRYVDPVEIEREAASAAESPGRGDGGPQAAAHLTLLHRLLLRPFERPPDIGGFAASLLDALSHISQHSPANRHPFAPAFLEAMIRSLDRLRCSRLATETLDGAAGYFRLAAGALAAETVPFDGTPLKRLQVLGFLETRNLRFGDLHVLDCNEGALPRRSVPGCILPLALRRELGLPGPRQRDDGARYYFENLVAGASSVHCYYREGAAHERSRFVERLLWQRQRQVRAPQAERPAPVFFASDFGQRDPDPAPKGEAMAGILRSLTFSTSKLDLYLHCPLAFRYRHLLGLGEPGADSGGIDRRRIGTLVHETLEEFFAARTGRPLDLSGRDREELSAICRRRFRASFGGHQDGALQLVRHQVEARLAEFLAQQAAAGAATVVEACECRLTAPLLTKRGTVTLAGRIDRIDRRPEGIVIIDYKTGAAAGRPNHRRFDPGHRADWHRTAKSFQLPLYLLLYRHHRPDAAAREANSALLLLGGAAIEEQRLFSADDDREALMDRYQLAIVALVEEMLDPDTPFHPAPDPDTQCPHCPYRTPCGRQWMRPRS